MEVKLLRGWRGLKVGYIFTPLSRGQAKLLVKRGVAEEHKEPKRANSRNKKHHARPVGD